MELYWILRYMAIVIPEVAPPQKKNGWSGSDQITEERHHVFQTTGFNLLGSFDVKECGKNRPIYKLSLTCLVVGAADLTSD